MPQHFKWSSFFVGVAATLVVELVIFAGIVHKLTRMLAW